MRKAMSNKLRDRPVIPTTLHPLLSEITSVSWNTTPSKLPTFDLIWSKSDPPRIENFLLCTQPHETCHLPEKVILDSTFVKSSMNRIIQVSS
jgi:hypothetical protein